MSDSFLPSGAIDPPPPTFFSRDLSTSPVRIPRSVPDYISAPNSNVGTPTFVPSPSPSQRPMSPPETPSASVPGRQAALVEDWRAYTQKLRSHHEGERAHMAADRARMEEVMAEERGLWDRERDVFKARIAELEEALRASQKKNTDPNTNTPPVPLPLPGSRKHPAAAAAAAAITYSPGSNAVSTTGSIGSASQTVPQESGRDADGSPFYAPASRNPSRTFDPAETAELRLGSITTPQESAIRVTSKELTSSDFGVQSSPASTHDLQTIDESPVESIDISHIQPELEGVAIRASAVSPTFVAKVLSPYRSPPSLGAAATGPPARDITNRVRSPPAARKEKHQKTLDIVHQAENQRLTMHAGHTPNHSISKFPFLEEPESGSATPTQEHHHHAIGAAPERGSSTAPPPNEAHEPDPPEDDQGDQELSGPLGLTNEAAKDDEFVAQLVGKLEEVRKSAGASPGSESDRSPTPPATREDRGEEKDEGPKLRLKPSCNFGKPLGTM